jgi:hypothetical protein
MVLTPDAREDAWSGVHEALPARWRVGRPTRRPKPEENGGLPRRIASGLTLDTFATAFGSWLSERRLSR